MSLINRSVHVMAFQELLKKCLTVNPRGDYTKYLVVKKLTTSNKVARVTKVYVDIRTYWKNNPTRYGICLTQYALNRICDVLVSAFGKEDFVEQTFEVGFGKQAKIERQFPGPWGYSISLITEAKTKTIILDLKEVESLRLLKGAFNDIINKVQTEALLENKPTTGFYQEVSDSLSVVEPNSEQLPDIRDFTSPLQIE